MVSRASRFVLLCSFLLFLSVFLSGCINSKCITASDCPLGAARCVNGECVAEDDHGCVSDGGYEWCAALQKCVQPWTKECTASNQNGSKP